MTKQVEDFMEEAKVKYQEQVDFQILKIAKGLLADHQKKEKEAIQKDCPHSSTSSYNHGYHKICNDCGFEL